MDTLFARDNLRWRAKDWRVLRKAVFDPARPEGTPRGRAVVVPRTRWDEGTAVDRILVLSLQRLRTAALADSSNGDPRDRSWILRRLRPIVSGRAEPDHQQSDGFCLPPFAGIHADRAAGCPGIHSGLAVRHRSVGRRSCNHDSYRGLVGKVVFGIERKRRPSTR